MARIAEDNLNGNFNAASVSGVDETLRPSKSLTNIASDKQTKNVKKDKVGEEKTKTRNAEAQTLIIAPKSENKVLKRKASHPPTSEMVMDSIKTLKKRNGATFEDIRKHIEEKYAVNMKVLEHHINKFLQKSVDNGVLENIDGAGKERKFKIKKVESTKKLESIKKKDSENVRRNEKKAKSVKKNIAAKK